MFRLFAALLWVAIHLPAQAGGKKDPEFQINFHIEAQVADNPSHVFGTFVAGQQRTFRRIPVVFTTDIASFNPFPSRDGEGYGVLFKLKAGAANRLAGESSAAVGRWILARVNGRPVDAVLIDQPLQDGEIVIFKGVGLGEIQSFDESLPRIGETKPRGKQK